MGVSTGFRFTSCDGVYKRESAARGIPCSIGVRVPIGEWPAHPTLDDLAGWLKMGKTRFSNVGGDRIGIMYRGGLILAVYSFKNELVFEAGGHDKEMALEMTILFWELAQVDRWGNRKSTPQKVRCSYGGFNHVSL